MKIKTIVTHHLVKGGDLNHHGTLYAGRTAEWFVEAGFFAAAYATKPENIVCLKIHGMIFTRPVASGTIVEFVSKIVHGGRTSLVAYIEVKIEGETVVSGFITFVHVDLQGKPIPHGLVITPTNAEDIDLQEKAKALSK